MTHNLHHGFKVLAKRRGLRWSSQARLDPGFSLVEVLVAVVVLSIGVLGTVAGFNLITQSINRSTGYNQAQLAIDNDVTRIEQLARLYTPCEEPLGEVPEAFPYCNGLVDSPEAPGPNYYFPSGSGGEFDEAAAQAFAAACRSTNQSTHFVANLVTLIDEGGSLPENITRNVERQDPSDPKNPNIKVSYSSDQIPFGRTLLVAPFAYAWCP